MDDSDYNEQETNRGREKAQRQKIGGAIHIFKPPTKDCSLAFYTLFH